MSKIDLELVRARWNKCYGRRSGKTLERIVEFLGSLEFNEHKCGVFLLHQISDHRFMVQMLDDVRKLMDFPPLERQGMLNYRMGEYRIRFVSKDNEKALLGISGWAKGEDHWR